MKRLSLYLALLLVVTLPACDVLDTSPSTALPTDDVFTSGDNLRAALVGAYDGVQGFADDYIIMPELASDNALHSGSYPSWQEVDNFNMPTNNAEASGQWQGSYYLINITNNIIANGPNVAPGAGFTAANRDAIIGEAKVLRAFAYHNLVRWFGGVPLALAPSEGAADVFLSRATREQVYDQIVKDLTEAEAAGVLPARVKGLLARVYLYREQWQQAAAKAQETLALAPLTTTGYAPDAIWTLAYSTQDANSLSFFAFPTNAGGRYEYAPTASIRAAFTASDARTPLNVATVSGQPTIVKYNRVQTDDDPVYLLRSSEMVLTRAEALAELGGGANEAEALSLLNQIRTRAGLPALQNVTGSALLDAILAERRLELAFEGHRWHDLVRTGRAVSELGVPNQNKTLWPIPQRDIDINKNLTQNEGY